MLLFPPKWQYYAPNASKVIPKRHPQAPKNRPKSQPGPPRGPQMSQTRLYCQIKAQNRAPKDINTDFQPQ